MIELMPCTSCGQFPVENKTTTSFGHGCYLTEHWLECPCGLATKRIADYGRTNQEAKDKVIDIWNKGNI